MRIWLILAYLFFIGSCFGWILELFYRNIRNRNKVWINPEFCTGLYLPIYGFGLCAAYLLASLERFGMIADPFWNKAALFASMAIGMTLIEYVAGVFFQKYCRYGFGIILKIVEISKESSVRSSQLPGRYWEPSTIF